MKAIKIIEELCKITENVGIYETPEYGIEKDVKDYFGINQISGYLVSNTKYLYLYCDEQGFNDLKEAALLRNKEEGIKIYLYKID